VAFLDGGVNRPLHSLALALTIGTYMNFLDTMWVTLLKLDLVGCPIARVRSAPMAMAHEEGMSDWEAMAVNAALTTSRARRSRTTRLRRS
jgi:hypothetical protein